jgi:RNA polymerase sigma-70 factor (ECF subfamily)
VTDTPNTGRSGRVAEFEGIVLHYEAMLLRYATQVLGGNEGAPDVVQEAFIRLYRLWRDEAFEPGPKLQSWLFRVVHNCAVDHIRTESRRRNLHTRHAETVDETVDPDRGEGFRMSEEAERVLKAMRALDLREREIVALKVFHEKSYKEIAEIMDLTSTNVGYILHHAMKKLAKEMKGRNL